MIGPSVSPDASSSGPRASMLFQFATECFYSTTKITKNTDPIKRNLMKALPMGFALRLILTVVAIG
jgi:hypothetical protein